VCTNHEPCLGELNLCKIVNLYKDPSTAYSLRCLTNLRLEKYKVTQTCCQSNGHWTRRNDTATKLYRHANGEYTDGGWVQGGESEAVSSKTRDSFCGSLPLSSVACPVTPQWNLTRPWKQARDWAVNGLLGGTSPWRTGGQGSGWVICQGTCLLFASALPVIVPGFASCCVVVCNTRACCQHESATLVPLWCLHHICLIKGILRKC